MHATVRPPGSKSLTNRFLACAALADGDSTFRGVTLSDDVLAMIAGLRALGARIDLRGDEGELCVHGCRGFFPADAAEIDVGHAGAPMRFLTALACLGQGRFRLDGSPRMRKRPIGDLVSALQAIGGKIGYGEIKGYPPLTVLAGRFTGGTAVFERPPSSQFISALLMAAPCAAADVFVRIDGGLVSRPYVDLTIAVMRAFSVEALTTDGDRFVVPAPQRYVAADATIEPDASAAAYFWAAAAITGGRVCVEGLSRQALQGDVGFVDVLERMGCVVESTATSLAVSGPPRGSLRGVDVDLNAMPDTAQTLAVAALFARGPTRIRNVANLRIKETDRLAALQVELTKLGASVQLHDDGLSMTPPEKVRAAAIDTYDDHRMVMSFALAGLAAEGVEIRDISCVSKSYPRFFEDLESLESRPA